MIFVVSSMGENTYTGSGTILARSYPYPWYKVCVPNCGYHYTVQLSNGTTFHYLDTCEWSVGQSLNFSYWTKAGWSNAVVICD